MSKIITILTSIGGKIDTSRGAVAIYGRAQSTQTMTGDNTFSTSSAFSSSAAALGGWLQVPTGSCTSRQFVYLSNDTSGSYLDIAANNTASTNVFTRLPYGVGINLAPSSSQLYWVKGVGITGSYSIRAVEN